MTLNNMPSGVTSRFTIKTYEKIVALENDLLGFSERLGHLANVYAEAELVTRGKPFCIYHQPMWNMLTGEYDSLVIDLASWAKAFHGETGILRTIEKRGELAAIAHGWPQEGAVDGQEEVIDQWRTKSFRRLFPCASTNVASTVDVRYLCAGLYCDFEPLRKDRNQNRAHKYEQGPVRASRLATTDLIKHLDKCQELVADIRRLASNTSFAQYGYKVKPTTGNDEARDVVDLILGGSMCWIVDFGFLANPDPTAKYYWQMREARFHVLHEAAGKPEEPFNNRALAPMPVPPGA